jgi:cytochrome c-type biogenesis protein CcmH
MRSLLVALFLFMLAGPGAAKEALPTADDPVSEKRVMAIADELRCLVCQNQTIADSHAGLAADLKNQIREKVKAGLSDEAIIDYVVARYGDFVLYRPPVKASTALLWFGPFLLLLGGIVFLFVYLKQRRKAQQDGRQLSEAEHARARKILGDPEAEA